MTGSQIDLGPNGQADRLPIAVCLAAALLSALALLRMPYGYYQFLRLVVTVSAGFMAWRLWQGRKITLQLLATLFALTGVLFNQIFVVHLSRAEWRPINVLAAVLFGLGAVFSRPHRTAK